MGLFNKKSDAEKQRKQELRDARQDARHDKREARKDAREDKRTARKDARETKKDERQDARDERRDARQDAREIKKDLREDRRDLKQDVRDSGLTGQDKRDALRDVRQTTRDDIKAAEQEKDDRIGIANQEKRDDIHDAREQKRDRLDEAQADKRSEIDRIRRDKQAAFDALKIPRARARRWNSYLRFQELRPEEIYRPETLEHLQTLCRLAAEHDVEIRAVGSGHSFSEVGHTEGILVETHQLDAVLPLAPRERKRRLRAAYHGSAGGRLVEVEAGIKIIDLSKALEPMGLALANQGTYDGQALWGAVSTSTHGSGLGRGPFPDMVRSVVLVGEGGRTFRIEPADGITEPDGWREADVDELVQDDDAFYSVVCSMGCMGLVYSAVIEARPFYWFDEWTYVTTWETFKEAFADTDDLRGLLEAWDSVSLLVAPDAAHHGQKKGVRFKGEHPCSIELRQETDERRTIGGRGFDPLAKALESVGVISGNAPAAGREDLFNFTKLKGDDSWLARTAVTNGAKRGWKGGALDPDTHRDRVPAKRRNKCYKIFPKGGKLFGGYGIELAFPLERTVEMMDRLLELAAENEGAGRDHTAPIAVRFVAPSKAYASPQFGRETVMFEVLMAKGTEEGAGSLRRIERAMLEEPDVRVHWGLNLDQMNEERVDLAAMYPRWPRWRETFRRFNRQGLFHNAFTRRMGISD